MEKIIGIIGRKRNINDREFLVFNNELINIICDNSCIPLGILLDFKSDIYKNLIDKCDGIILQGGNDHYFLDDDIIKYIHKKNIPTLGICLGMQIMGNAFNGKIKSLDKFNHDSKNDYVHTVKVDDNSLLFKIINKKEFLVNSRHKDNIIKTDLNISAYSEDNIIEAIEDNSKDFFIDVQWHPETIINDEISRKIFDSFFDKVKSYHR